MKLQIHIIPVDPCKPPGFPSAPGPPPETRWHYTTGQKLNGILTSGEIRPSTAHLDAGEQPVVWFSSRPIWEPTATKCFVSGKLGQLITAQAQGGLVRIAVPASTAPYTFQHIHVIAGTTPETCVGLILAGLEMGADPNDWWFTPQSVSAVLFRAIELYDFEQDQWRPLSISELACRN